MVAMLCLAKHHWPTLNPAFANLPLA